MYTILLVDDDETILNNLHNMIEWSVYGIEHILTATNGVSALELLSSYMVDLLITDISMPHMDGLELIQKVRESHPHIHCIVLTSYSDFNYAKKAISLQIENYLLKPLQVEELDSSIRKSIDNISMHKTISHSLLLNNILHRWVTNNITSDELSERAKHLCINIYAKQYCTILIKASQTYPNRVVTLSLSYFRHEYDAYHFIDYDGHHVIILAGYSISPSYIESSFKKIFQEKDVEDFQAFIGVIIDGYESVNLSYQSTIECMLPSHSSAKQYYFANKQITLNFDNLQINHLIEHLNVSIDTNDMNWILPVFHKLFPDISDYALEEINTFLKIIPAKLAFTLISYGLIAETEKDTLINSSYYFEEAPEERDIFLWFLDIISICQMLIKKHAMKLSPIVASAIQYISENHTSYASIKDFCNKHSMNASYLGLLFKKETGIYFNDYLNRLRINHAIQLLKNTSHKVSKICQQTGYTNSSYFISCFRKYTGVSPSKFRRKYPDL